MNKPTCTYHYGQRVTRPGFTDCKGAWVEPIEGLTVCRITLIESSTKGPLAIKPYFRIAAVNHDTGAWAEGAERFFTPA